MQKFKSLTGYDAKLLCQTANWITPQFYTEYGQSLVSFCLEYYHRQSSDNITLQESKELEIDIENRTDKQKCLSELLRFYTYNTFDILQSEDGTDLEEFLEAE